jgi:hypothetical protein
METETDKTIRVILGAVFFFGFISIIEYLIKL